MKDLESYKTAISAISAELNDIDAEWRVLNRHLAAGTISVEAWHPMHEADLERIAELNEQFAVVKRVYEYVLEQQIGALDEDEALPEPSPDEWEKADQIAKHYEPDFGI